VVAYVSWIDTDTRVAWKRSYYLQITEQDGEKSISHFLKDINFIIRGKKKAIVKGKEGQLWQTSHAMENIRYVYLRFKKYHRWYEF
jgi:hypothetical protein